MAPEEEKRYRMLLGLVRSNDVTKQIQGLQTLHQMSRQGISSPPSTAQHFLGWAGVPGERGGNLVVIGADGRVCLQH